MSRGSLPRPPATGTDGPRHRSGAVARMLRMPVATLRVWERRYAITQPALSPSGQRLYSADDVRRLALLKQLCDLGHAIGSLAGLDMAQLREVAATHAGVLSAAQAGEPAPAPADPAGAWQVAVVGADLATRLQRAALLQGTARPVQWHGPYADVAEAAEALQGVAIDALVLHEPRLHAGWLAALQAAAPALVPVRHAVLYRFAADTECEALAQAGMQLLREPQNDTVLAQWLLGVLGTTAAGRPVAPPVARPIPPRRWADAALADFAGLSTTIACECPRHIAELLIQLGHFEAYSAECEQRSPADARLHAHLREVAGESRARFEAALEHVAQLEGLLLPGAGTPPA